MCSWSSVITTQKLCQFNIFVQSLRNFAILLRQLLWNSQETWDEKICLGSLFPRTICFSGIILVINWKVLRLSAARILVAFLSFILISLAKGTDIWLVWFIRSSRSSLNANILILVVVCKSILILVVCESILILVVFESILLLVVWREKRSEFTSLLCWVLFVPKSPLTKPFMFYHLSIIHSMSFYDPFGLWFLPSFFYFRYMVANVYYFLFLETTYNSIMKCISEVILWMSTRVYQSLRPSVHVDGPTWTLFTPAILLDIDVGRRL